MINPTNLQFGLMLTQSVKYALTQSNHVPTMTCDYVKPLIGKLDLSILYIIEKDISNAHKAHTIDAECKVEWLALRNDIQREIERRKDEAHGRT